MLVFLDGDMLRVVVGMVNGDDLLPLALTCKALHTVCLDCVRVDSVPRWVTGGTVTSARVIWAVETMGATLTARWCVYAMRHGHTDALMWMKSNGVAMDPHGMVAVALWG